MTNPILGQRGNALEHSFFAKENEKLIERLRNRAQHQEKRDALHSATGISDDAVLSELIALDIHVETLAAFSLVPSVLVAWADGKMEDKEREAILRAAEEFGIEQESASHDILQSWLSHPPQADLLQTWKAYTRELHREMQQENCNKLRDQVMERARQIAQSAGGFLGLGSKVSAAEHDILLELEKAFK